MVSCLRHCNLSNIKGRSKVHVVKAHSGFGDILLHLFFTSALDGIQWLNSHQILQYNCTSLCKSSLCYKALTCGFSWGISHNDSPVNLFQKYGRFPLLLQNLRHPCWSNSGGNSGSIYIPGGIPCKTTRRVISFLKSHSASKEYG